MNIRPSGEVWEGGSWIVRVRESYRYDPLGRRILVRASTVCGGPIPGADRFTDCDTGTLRRTVWNGDRELVEIQRPVAGVGGMTLAMMESDVSALDLPFRMASTHPTYRTFFDPNPMYGRVAYTHGIGIDRPLSVTRFAYTDRTANSSLNNQWGTFTLVPHWDARGQAATGTFSNGAARKRMTVSGVVREVGIDWPLSAAAFSRYVRSGALTWQGTLIHQKVDAVGTLYRRNRSYDPSTGRFTQQDPIGLAGGLNLYGFAGGDPINFSDPFGLKAEESAADDGPEEDADPCETDPRSEACQARNRMKDLAASYCSSAKNIDATIYSGGTFEVALGWGLSGSMGAYASPSEFGIYVRGGLHFGLEGSLTSETGVARGGLSGVALAGSAGTATAVAGAVGFYPSLSGTAAIQSGPGIPLSGSVSLTYTHTFPIGKCK